MEVSPKHITFEPSNNLCMNIPFESKLQPILDISERNKAFHLLSDKEKRQEIAYDLFLLMLDEILRPAYCYWGGKTLETMMESPSSTEIFNLANNISKKDQCMVCVRGGMMLSQIRLGNRVQPSSSLSCGDRYNLDGFTLKTFEVMEAVYEGYDSYGEWVEQHPFESNSRRSIMNICLNVIVNGDFNRWDFTNYIQKFNIVTTGKNKTKINSI